MKKINNIYIYDGSFPNLLTIIKYLFQENILPLDIKENYQEDLFSQNINLNLETDEKIIPNIVKNMGLKIFNGLYYLYLSNKDNKEMLIYYFLLYSLRYQEKVFILRNVDILNEAIKTIKYVGRENHKMKGFIRFKELKGGVLYAEFSPTNNVLPLVVKHFQKRLKKEVWLIQDVKRKVCAYYNTNLYFLDMQDTKINLNELAKDEVMMENLWKTFYKSVSLKERVNERCRMNFMPKKYWSYIMEVSDEESY